ncbi:MAG: glycosyltransferase family 2 protein [Vicinamibacterales bacterium]
MLALLLVSIGVLWYIVAGYPLALRLLVWLRGPRLVRRGDIRPRVSLVISAYNEAAVIRQKIENALALDYPSGLLDVVVVSDESDDGTDDIVREFADRGVVLARQVPRRGKTAGLNRTVPGLQGEIVVFSDANAMYEPDALLKLVRNFADPSVGFVTGEARYLDTGMAAADVGERAYWSYEMQVKRLETAVGSMVGGDGAIYAIRRELWRELPENAINDFLNPLQIVEAGWRGVYEPEAVAWEETAGATGSEYRRRVRIVSRSWRAVFLAPGVLNPFRVGLFTWCLLSHKVLRWFIGLFAAGALVGGGGLYIQAVTRWPLPVLGATAAAAIGLLTLRGRQLLSMAGYFLALNVASTKGLLMGSLGQVSGVWSTPRAAAGTQPAAAAGAIVPVGTLFLAGAAVVVATGVVALFRIDRPAFVLFWGSVGVLGYIYAGYPLLIGALNLLARRPVQASPFEPAVCLFIAANDEEAVMESKLRNALRLDYPPDRLEIVVASDGSVDRTNEIVRGFGPRVRLIEFSPRRGKIATINDGLRQIDSDVIIFSDANTFLQADAVRALVRNFADERVGGVSGDVVLVGERASLAKSEDLYYRYERWLQRVESEIGSMIGADGALYAIRRELFAPPAPDTILDDMAIPMAVLRAGRRMVFEPDARAWEQGSESAMQEFARKSRVIAGGMQFLRRRDSSVPLAMPQVILSLVSHKALRWLSPLFATSALLSSLTLSGVWPGYAAAAWAQATLLGLGLAGCVPALRRSSTIAIAHYFCLIQTAAATGLIWGLSGRQSVLWRRFVRVPADAPFRVIP